MPIQVVIVEDDGPTRRNLSALLNNTSNLRCVNVYASAETALKGIPSDNPDVALVDINLPGMSGIECVGILKQGFPKLQILMITTYEERELIFNSLRAGASGYLLKNMPHHELVSAIEQVHVGGAPMSMQIARKVVEHFYQIRQPKSESEKLTQREHEVLTLLAKGCLDKEIVDKLGISFTTVRTHLKHIYEKLHVNTRTEAAVKFLAGQGGHSSP